MEHRLVYVCEGGDCTERGSGDLYDSLKELLEARDPGEKRNRLRRYPCFGGCEFGINLAVFPDRVFYSHVTESDLPEVVAHLMGEGAAPARLTGAVPKDVEQVLWDMLDAGF